MRLTLAIAALLAASAAQAGGADCAAGRHMAAVDTNSDGVITPLEFRAARFAAALDRLDPSLYYGEPRQLRIGLEISFR